MTGTFLRVKCKDCGNSQIMFSRASTVVKCQVCGTVMASPTGGKAELHVETVEEVQ